MISMLYLPFHWGFVSIIVQKLLVDYCAKHLVRSEKEEDITWFYASCCMVVSSQFISMGLARWADVTQTQNRGRTGGIRQDHRQKIFQKFLQLEQAEHWDASGTSWLYCALQDVDVIVMNAYWQVFIFAQ